MTGRPGYQPKTRNTHFRKRKRIILLATEGANRTESLYFKSISWQNCVIRFAHGNYTDPVNMVTALKKEYDELELDIKLGECRFLPQPSGGGRAGTHSNRNPVRSGSSAPRWA